MSIIDFLSTAVQLGIKYAGTIGFFARIVADLAAQAPKLLEFILEGVQAAWDAIQAMIDDGAGDEEIAVAKSDAREALVQKGLAEFHGSGSAFSEAYIRTGIEAVFKIWQVFKQGPSHINVQEDLARNKGYLKSPDIDHAIKTYPQLFGIKP